MEGVEGLWRVIWRVRARLGRAMEGMEGSIFFFTEKIRNEDTKIVQLYQKAPYTQHTLHEPGGSGFSRLLNPTCM
jgi:hypothetical protein